MTVISYLIPPDAIATVRTWPGVSINENVNVANYEGWAFAILNASQIVRALQIGAVPYRKEMP